MTAPDGGEWRWTAGDAGAAGTAGLAGDGDDRANEGADEGTDTVHGTALDFCLVVTQRRNVVDTGLEVVGDLAHDWISVAQAFAGPPGPGRPPV